ncbi:MAG: response regulator [Pseudomonadota bacterium]
MNAIHTCPDEILVVDDASASLKLLENILSNAGYLVRLARDGELALRSAKIQPPALVLLDIRMPGMDGYEVCQRLKDDEKTRSIPVIFLSILEDEREKVKAFRVGGVDFINKPISAAEVLARVNTHLVLRHAQLDLESRNVELDATRATLEERVKERSAELEQTNRKLQQQIDVHLHTLESLRKSELNYRRIVDTANEGIWVLGPDYLTTFANARMLEMLGYNNDEMTGRPVTDFMFDEDVPDFHARMEKRRQGISEDYELRYLRRDGQTVWTLESATPVFDAERNFNGSFGMLTDITKRKLAEEALKRIEWMLSPKHTATLEGPDDGQNQGYGDLTALNRDGVILKSVGHDVLGSIAADYLDLLGTSSAIYEVNGDYAFGIFASNWCRMLDRASRKLCDTDDNAAALISGQWLCHESCWTRCSKEAIATRGPVDIECSGGIRLYGVPIVAGETVIGSINFGYGDIPNDPVKLRALANAYHLNYEDLLAEFNVYNSRPPYIIEMAKSRLHASARLIGILVERQHAEEEIHKLNEELEQRVADRTALLEAAIKELEAFAYTVSHNLRAPLRHIDGFLALLQKRTATALDEQSRHYMGAVSESAKHMGVLIDDLLFFSRMGRNQMSKLRVDLSELTREVIREFEPETGSRNILWRISDLPVMNGDRAMLRIVLVNLISNALKFTRMRPQAEIEIGWMRAQEGETVIFVRDNGVGFDMTYGDKLFGIFQRLHRADEFEGTGIGLANVRRIINRHGGRTWAEGQVNRGATFYFTLPKER